MIDIIISVVIFIFLILCAMYVIKEIIRRKKQIHDDNFLETNWKIGGAIGAWVFSAVVIIGFTIAHYVSDFNLYHYILSCVLGMIALIISFLLAFNKIIINKETGNIVAYGFIKRKNFNVKKITLIKHKVDALVFYAGKERLFWIGLRYHNYNNSFYVYIRKESKCEEKYPKGYAGRNIDE